MSFEDAINNVFHSEIQEMMGDADYYQQNFDFSTKFVIPDEKIKENIVISANSKHNKKDSEWETDLSMKFNVSWQWEKVKVDWNAIIKQLKHTFYLKLNSLNVSNNNEYFDTAKLGFDKIKWQRFFLDLNDEKIEEMFKNNYNSREFSESFKISNLYNKTKIDNFINEFKESLINEWALVYSGTYSQFNWYNAYKFWIDKEKALTALLNYFRWIAPDDIIDDAFEDIEYENRDEIFEGFPFTSFEWYLVITWKHKVQIVIENIDIDDYPHTSKLNATFGKDIYKLVWTEDGKDMIVISAILTGSHYDISMKVEDLETLSWTITPSISNWKVSIDFDLVMKYEDYGDLVKIPLKGSWTKEKISEFDVKAPNNYKNLLEELPNNYFDNETEYSNITEYNDKLVDLVKECRDASQELYKNYDTELVTIDSMEQSVRDAIIICQWSQEKASKMWNYDGDSSLKDGVVDFLTMEVEYLQKFLSAKPYRNIDNMTDKNKVTYNWIVDELNESQNLLNKQFTNLQDIQEIFAEKHGLILNP